MITAAIIVLYTIIPAGLYLIVKGTRADVRDDKQIGPDWTHQYRLTDPHGNQRCVQTMVSGGPCDLSHEEHRIVYGSESLRDWLMKQPPHTYAPNKIDPGHCAALVRTHDGLAECLLTKEFHS